MHVHVCKKDDIFRQRRLNHSGVGEEFMVKMPCQSYHIQRPYVSLFFLLTLTQIDLWVQKFFIACCLVRFAAFLGAKAPLEMLELKVKVKRGIKRKKSKRIQKNAAKRTRQ